MSEIVEPGNLHFRAISYTGLEAGPRLIVLGAVHGNETCGTKAIERAIAQIDDQLLRIKSGSVCFVPIANPLAYIRRQREGDRNLNRNLYPVAQVAHFEDRIANLLCPLLARHDVLLDLHSFHTGGEPFVMVGPQDNSGELESFRHAAEERALATRLGVRRFVDGWLDTYARGVANRVRKSAIEGAGSNRMNLDARYGVGTTEYMRSVGGYALTLECGQHDDPSSPEVGYRAILNTLAFLKISGEPEPEPIGQAEILRLHEVVDKFHADDRFARDWSSFDRLLSGDLIGTRAGGTPVIAEKDGFIVFPNPKATAGQEWFYLADEQPSL